MKNRLWGKAGARHPMGTSGTASVEPRLLGILRLALASGSRAAPSLLAGPEAPLGLVAATRAADRHRDGAMAAARWAVEGVLRVETQRGLRLEGELLDRCREPLDGSTGLGQGSAQLVDRALI